MKRKMKKVLSMASFCAAAWVALAAAEADRYLLFVICLGYMVFWMCANAGSGSGRREKERKAGPQLYDLTTDYRIGEEVKIFYERDKQRANG